MKCWFCGSDFKKKCNNCKISYQFYKDELSYIYFLENGVYAFTIITPQKNWNNYENYYTGYSKLSSGDFKIFLPDYYLCNNSVDIYSKCLEKLKINEVFG